MWRTSSGVLFSELPQAFPSRLLCFVHKILIQLSVSSSMPSSRVVLRVDHRGCCNTDGHPKRDGESWAFRPFCLMH